MKNQIMKTETPNYNAAELAKLNIKSLAIYVKITDFDGKSTKTLGANTFADCADIMRFLRARAEGGRLGQSHMVEVKYLAPTNTRGSRVQLKTYDLQHYWNNGKPKSKTLPFDHAVNGGTGEIAELALRRAGFEIIARNDRGPNIVFMLEWNFEKFAEFFGVETK